MKQTTKSSTSSDRRIIILDYTDPKSPLVEIRGVWSGREISQAQISIRRAFHKQLQKARHEQMQRVNQESLEGEIENDEE